MSLISGLAIYFILWWLCLFVVLPWRVRGQHEQGNMLLGTDPGAPSRPLLVKKALATTVLAAILFAGVYLYFGVYELTLEDLLT